MVLCSEVVRTTILLLASWKGLAVDTDTSVLLLAGPAPNGWQTQSNVTTEASISIDLIEMIESDKVADKKKWYQQGHGEKGELTLMSLGFDAKNYSALDPLFNIYVDTFLDIGLTIEDEDSGIFDKNLVEQYAHSIVDDLFLLNDEQTSDNVETVAILVTGLWMRVHHYLYENLRLCRSNGDTHIMLNNIDKAAALWIGKRQVYGSNTEGVLLYNLAEIYGFHFGQDVGESRVNSKFLSILAQMKSTVDNNECNSKSDNNNVGYNNMHKYITDALRQMNTLLVQGMIHSFVTGVDDKYTQLYALSILPQIRACSISEYQYFLENFIITAPSSKESLNIAHLQKMYSCLGVTCEDIGAYSGDRVPQCEGNKIEPTIALASYTPSSDVHVHSKADRDMLQIKILLRQRNVEAAKDLYEKGRNMVERDSTAGYSTPSSLQYLASGMKTYSYTEDKIRLYNMFEDYYDKNQKYADNLVLQAFDSAEALTTVPILLQTIVAPHFAVRSFFEAVDVCEDFKERAMSVFDQGVVVLVGSNEGTEVGGSKNGVSWFALAKEYCAEFNCNDPQDSSADTLIMESILKIKESILGSKCNDLETEVDKIESILLIPIIQGLLFHTEMLRLNPDMATHHASVQTFAQAIIPIIAGLSKVQAHIIEDSTSISLGETIDSLKVWTAIGRILKDAYNTIDLGITCEQIGKPKSFPENLFEAGLSLCEFTKTLNHNPTRAPVRFIDKTDAPTNAPSVLPTRADEDFRINRVLIKDRYTFTNMTQAEENARIALDLRDIIQLAFDNPQKNEEERVVEAKAIYTQGRNANPLTLQDFGTSAPIKMKEDPFYNVYRQAWREELIFNDFAVTGENVVDTFADAVAISAFDEASDLELASESVVALTMWMQIVHLLTTEVESCQRNANLGGSSVDTAFAYYLGVKQSKGDSNGYLLYSLAQKAAIAQGTIDYSNGGEAYVNIRIIPLFQQAKEYAQNCNVNDLTSFKLLRETVGEIISTMNTPMVQFIEHYLVQMRDNIEPYSSNVENYVELYALAILPQLAVCAPTAYNKLKLDIIDETIVTSVIDDILTVLLNNYKCLGIECTDVHRNGDDCPDERTALAGFVPAMNVNDNAKIDQDILKIRALVKEEAIDAAKDYYEFGDPLSPGDPLYSSLKTLVLSDLIKKSPFYEDFKKYNDDNDEYANFFIMEAFSFEPVEEQVITRALQTMVLFPAGLGSIMSAIETCEAGQPYDLVVRHWDRAAAFLIGSIEGDQQGGDEDGNGLGIFGLAKEVCREFSSCTRVGSASVNDRLVDDFTTGEQLILASVGNGIGDCSTLEEFVTKDIIPTLLVPVIQATLHAVYKGEQSSASTLARSIIPIVNGVDPVSAVMISEETHTFNGTFNVTRVADAFARVIGRLGISCSDFIWKKLKFDFCSAADDNSEGTNLSNGLYVTSTNVQEWANIDLDIVDMIEAIKNKNTAMAEDFYLNGFNSHIKDKNGTKIGIRSLGQMSLNVNMVEEPVFNLFRYALQDDNGDYIGDNVKFYAHSLVMLYFNGNDQRGESNTLPAEAAIALNLWGNIVHKLYATLERCGSGSFQDDNGVQYIDQAAAYWIGSAQLTGDSSKGHLLYRLTEEAGELFGQGINGQARNNRKILRLLTEASRVLSSSNGCEVKTSADSLRVIVNKIVAQMTVPMIQHLIANLQANDLDRIRLYGHAVVPLIAGCNKGTYNHLREKLLINSEFSSSTKDDIISHLQSTYSCLGITCNDVGDLANGDIPGCRKRKDFAAFAGYTPRTNSQEYSNIDIDIRYIEIMLRMNAYKAAKDVYTRGKHVMVENGSMMEPLSLQQLATATGRKSVPSFLLFRTYFSNQDYADSAIMKVFNEPIIQGKEGKSNEQKRAEIVDILRFMVTPMAALQKFYEAYASCNIMSVSISKISHKRWDEGAALLIGSMEGSRNGGSGDGYLIYGLANSLCLKFGVCGTQGHAQVNDAIMEALYAGASSLSDHSCDNVIYSMKEIKNQMIIPLIQASLLTAVENSKLRGYTGAESIASGYVYSRAILPYFQDQTKAATVISKNLNFEVGFSPIADGWQSVFVAFGTIVDNMDDIDCRDVGFLSTVDAGICPDDTATNGSALLSSSLCSVLLLVSLSWIIITC